MKTDDIISYHELVAAEKANLQKGMNFGIGRDYSVVLEFPPCMRQFF
jgi:hypothetical protein